MKDLSNVTLVVIDCKYYDESLIAIDKCVEHCKFGDVIVFSDVPFYKNTILIPKITSKITYSEFVMKHLVDHIKTEFIMIAQYDGYILNPDAWMPEFLHYDYIGACWEYDVNNVGNGGFSIRSTRLMREMKKSEFSIIHPEDYRICRFYRAELERRGFNFAPDQLANKFSWEENKRYPAYDGQFGWHGNPPKEYIEG